MVPHRSTPLLPQVQQPDTAGANLTPDKTRGPSRILTEKIDRLTLRLRQTTGNEELGRLASGAGQRAPALSFAFLPIPRIQERSEFY